MKTRSPVGSPEQRAPHRWWVPMGSMGVGYTVEYLPEGRYRCTCSGFRYRQRCSHIEVVKASYKGDPHG
jgi:hypothetical protein